MFLFNRCHFFFKLYLYFFFKVLNGHGQSQQWVICTLSYISISLKMLQTIKKQKMFYSEQHLGVESTEDVTAMDVMP